MPRYLYSRPPHTMGRTRQYPASATIFAPSRQLILCLPPMSILTPAIVGAVSAATSVRDTIDPIKRTLSILFSPGEMLTRALTTGGKSGLFVGNRDPVDVQRGLTCPFNSKPA